MTHSLGTPPELPSERWTLSAPESLVLLWGPETGDAWAVKTALLELVVRRAFRLVAKPERRFLRRPRMTFLLVPAGSLDPFAPHPLRVVRDVCPVPTVRVGGDVGTPVEVVARVLLMRGLETGPVRPGRRVSERRTGGYVAADVLPALAARGLYVAGPPARGDGPWGQPWRPSAAGMAALEELRAWLAIGRGPFREWAVRDPARAERYLERAGPAILLLGGLAPSIERVHRQASAPGEDRRLGREATDAGRPASGAGGFAAGALAGVFGPGPDDDLDGAFAAISGGVDRAWEALHDLGGAGE